jgi:hypothetical protein
MELLLRVADRECARRCAWCRADDGQLRACDDCGTVLHPGCWFSARRCPTLGCDPRPRRPRPRPRPARAGTAPARTTRGEAEQGLLVGALVYFVLAAQLLVPLFDRWATSQLLELATGVLGALYLTASIGVRLALVIGLVLLWRAPPELRARLLRGASIAWFPLVLLTTWALALPLLAQLLGGP